MKLKYGSLVAFTLIFASNANADYRLERYKKEQALRESLFAPDNPARYVVPPPELARYFQPPAPPPQPAPQAQPSSQQVAPEIPPPQQPLPRQPERLQPSAQQQTGSQHTDYRTTRQQQQRTTRPDPRTGRNNPQNRESEEPGVGINDDGSVRVRTGYSGIDRDAENQINQKVKRTLRMFGF